MAIFLMPDAEDVLGVRFALSPLWETMGAVRTFFDDRARPYHAAWHAMVADQVDRLDLQALAAVMPLRGFTPDFLTPPPRTASPRVRDQLHEVRATPDDQVARELRLCRASTTDVRFRQVTDEYLIDPASARTLLADRMQDVWSSLVAPFWTRIRTLLERDIEERTRQLARGGLRQMLAELHPRVRWTRRGLSIREGSQASVAVGERGLVLMPSAYVWPAVAAIVDEPWQPTIVYPARGIAELWDDPQPPPDALARLLGRTRALILAGLDQPSSTTATAAQMGLSPAGASGHLIALRNAGLVSASRRGHEVLYRRTPLGASLLRASAGRTN